MRDPEFNPTLIGVLEENQIDPKQFAQMLDMMGVVMVPKEPDSSMVLAAGLALGELSKTVKLSSLRPYEYLKPQWDAMLKASPYAKREADREQRQLSGGDEGSAE